jgi:hypothetical protein
VTWLRIGARHDESPAPHLIVGILPAGQRDESEPAWSIAARHIGGAAGPGRDRAFGRQARSERGAGARLWCVPSVLVRIHRRARSGLKKYRSL